MYYFFFLFIYSTKFLSSSASSLPESTILFSSLQELWLILSFNFSGEVFFFPFVKLSCFFKGDRFFWIVGFGDDVFFGLDFLGFWGFSTVGPTLTIPFEPSVKFSCSGSSPIISSSCTDPLGLLARSGRLARITFRDGPKLKKKKVQWK